MPEDSVASFVVSLAAVTTALAAVGVAVWQGVENRRHNRRSVQPYLTHYQIFSATRPCAGVELSNNGVGPAIITRFEVLVDGAVMEDDGSKGWCKALELLGLETDWTVFHWLDPGDAVRVGESLWLLAIPENDLDRDREQLLRAAIARLVVRIEYRSVYHETATLLAADHALNADRAA